MKLILFDVDGTLIKGSMVHLESPFVAIEKIFGINIERWATQEGGTDKKDVMEIAKRNNINLSEVESKLEKIYNEMVRYFEENVDKDERVVLLPGVKELLKKLSEKNYILGLLTGNVEEIAKIKMKKNGIDHFFEVGAFGGTTENRSELAPKAIKQTEKKFKIRIKKEDVIIVGDTPNDIKCAKDNGVKIIAVCTGRFKKEELEKLKPDYILDDLTDADKFLRIVNE